jgi:exosortase family protein XrtG
MTPGTLSVLVLVYLVGLIIVYRQQRYLLRYLWASFGFVAIVVIAGGIWGWYQPMGAIEAKVLTYIGSWFNFNIESLESASLLVPTPEGWSVLQIGIECSTFIESAVFAGLLLFYPRIPLLNRLLRLVAGLVAIFIINLIRLGFIIGIVATLGGPAVPWAHAIVGRLLFFIGIVAVFWWIFTLPTLQTVRGDVRIRSNGAIRQ